MSVNFRKIKNVIDKPNKCSYNKDSSFRVVKKWNGLFCILTLMRAMLQ